MTMFSKVSSVVPDRICSVTDRQRMTYSKSNNRER